MAVLADDSDRSNVLQRGKLRSDAGACRRSAIHLPCGQAARPQASGPCRSRFLLRFRPRRTSSDSLRADAGKRTRAGRGYQTAVERLHGGNTEVRDEAQMIAKILAGDSQLFHELIRPYERRVYAMAYPFSTMKRMRKTPPRRLSLRPSATCPAFGAKPNSEPGW